MARDISISDYTYDLPDEKIATHPLENRDQSKLLVYKNGKINDVVFSDIKHHLPEKSLIVFNKTKVVRARILFSVPLKEKSVEIFILEPAGNIAVEKAMALKGQSSWLCLVGNNKQFKSDYLEKTVCVNGKEISLRAQQPKKTAGAFEVRFSWTGEFSFSEILDAAGLTPLPPYIKREVEEKDKSVYQTVYAKDEGSVAAPTAGLHFTESLLRDLKSSGHSTAELVLHVGAGTFRPVKTEKMEDHLMHNEEITVGRKTLVALKENHGKIISVGTTSLRTLETLFWLGLKLKMKPDLEDLHLSQWEPYDLSIPEGFDYIASINALLSYCDRRKENYIRAKTALLIAPGYTIRSVKGLITNFHQPNSTLLLLVAAFIGDAWKKIYEHALKNDYRFLSFGDSSLLLV